MRERQITSLMAFVSVAVSGCVVGPDFSPPPPPAIDRYASSQPLVPTLDNTPGEPGQRFVQARAVEAGWWRMFGSSTLDALEAQVLQHNNDVAAAQASVHQARELYLAQRAALLPLVQFAGSGARSKNSDTIASPLSSNAQSYSLYSGQLNFTYVMDVFGGERRLVENATAQMEVQQYQADAVYLTITANVAATVLQIASLNDQLAAQDAVIALNRRVLALTRDQAAHGEASAVDVATAENALEAAIQPRRALEKQAALLGDVLAVYLGRTPAELDLPLRLADFQVPADLPLTLPSDLVRERPDIRAAEANLHAASANVGVAIAARLPNLTLTGAAGGVSTTLGSLLSGPNTLWTVGANTGATVFDAGSLRHRQRASEAALDQAKAQYRGVVIAAIQNVADAMQSLRTDAEALGDASRSEKVLARAVEIAGAQTEYGQAGVLPTLNAEIAHRQSQAVLVQARAARLVDTVSLFQALGGGWSAPSNAKLAAAKGGR